MFLFLAILMVLVALVFAMLTLLAQVFNPRPSVHRVSWWPTLYCVALAELFFLAARFG